MYHFAPTIFSKSKKQLISKNSYTTTFTYEPKRRRLATMTAMSGTTMLFNNVYTYDKVDNILSITNNVPIPTQGLGGRTSSRFEYDEWNRLIFAEGSVATARNSGSFTLNMEYDKLFNIRRKNQFVDMAGAPQSLTHDFLYFYEDPQGPNRPSQIGSKDKLQIITHTIKNIKLCT